MCTLPPEVRGLDFYLLIILISITLLLAGGSEGAARGEGRREVVFEEQYTPEWV